MIQSGNFHISNEEITDNEEQFASVLNTILPEIEIQLMKDIERQLQSEFEQKYLKAIQEINTQALQQYQQAVLQLEESRHILEQQKQAETQKQIYHLQATLASLQQDALLKLQQQFLEENFDSRIMTHERILLLEKQIQEEIFTWLEQKHEVTKQRQLKELIIAHETKQIKLRKQLDTQIKSRIYCSSGLEELKQEIKQSRTQMGSQKSEYNLKLKKIEAEIKDYQDKIKEYQKMGEIKNLREKHQQLRVQFIEHQTEKQLEDDQRKRNQEPDEEDSNSAYGDNDSLDEQNDEKQQQNQLSSRNSHVNKQFSYSKTMKRQQKNHLLKPDSHIIRENNLHDQNDDTSSQHFVSSQHNLKKIDLTAYLKGYLLNSQTAQITQSQNFVQQDNEKQRKTLLNFGNLSDLLKQKVAMDPLERYLNKKNEFKQNDMNIQNLNHSTTQKTSNFAELYGQHLKNLNRGFGKKNDKKLSQKKSNCLSQMAKKTIIKNLSLYHRNNFGHSQNDQSRSQINYNVKNTGTQNFNSYESNLLGSYK